MRSALIPGTRDLSWDMIMQAKVENSLDRFVVRHHRRGMDWISRAMMERAVGLGVLFGQPGERGNTQAVVCERSRFESRKDAAKWVRDHDFRADSVVEEQSSFKFEQFPERLAEPDSFKRVKLDDGVDANTCKRAARERQDDDRSLDLSGSEDSVESFFSN